VLNVNPQFVVRLRGLKDDESQTILQYLYDRARIPEYQLRVRWAPNTVLMWDNRSVQHYAPHDYYPQRRYMERVTIKGGPVHGLERADPASVRRANRAQSHSIGRVSRGSMICSIS